MRPDHRCYEREGEALVNENSAGKTAQRRPNVGHCGRTKAAAVPSPAYVTLQVTAIGQPFEPVAPLIGAGVKM